MKRGTPRHPKVEHFRELAKISLPAAIGYLELLFHFTAEFAPQGDIGRYSDARIEAALCWSGTKGRLIRCLADAGWIDTHSEWRLVLHDWHDHADSAVKKRLERSQLPFLSLTPKVTGQRRTTADNGSLARARSLPEPEPEPAPAPVDASHQQEQQHVASPKKKTWNVIEIQDATDFIGGREPTWPRPDSGTILRILENVDSLDDLRLFVKHTASLLEAKGWGMYITESRTWPAVRGIAREKQKLNCRHGIPFGLCMDCEDDPKYKPKGPHYETLEERQARQDADDLDAAVRRML